MRMLRKLLESLIERFGYEFKVVDEPLRGYECFLAQCRRRGLAAQTVLDGGVGYGTPWLYNAFPDAKLVLFEPLEQFGPVIEEICRTHDATYHRVALGSEPGEMEINVAKDFVTASSLKKHSAMLLSAIESQGRERTYERQSVEIVRLDDINSYKPPYVLKLDVEGFELEALRGARETLKETELVILEASLMERYEDGETFLDVYKFLDEVGFALYEIIDIAVRSRDAPPGYLDAAFVPKASKLRVV